MVGFFFLLGLLRNSWNCRWLLGGRALMLSSSRLAKFYVISFAYHCFSLESERIFGGASIAMCIHSGPSQPVTHLRVVIFVFSSVLANSPPDVTCVRRRSSSSPWRRTRPAPGAGDLRRVRPVAVRGRSPRAWLFAPRAAGRSPVATYRARPTCRSGKTREAVAWKHLPCRLGIS